MLWLYQRTMFGACDNVKNQILKDLNFREIMTLVPLIIWAFWIGLYPKPFFKVLEKPVAAIVERVNPDFYRPAAASLTAPKQQVTQPLQAVQQVAQPLLAVQPALPKPAVQVHTQARVPVPPGSGGVTH
jgi:NADH-quinone oxidoreductase subunit M